MYESPIMLNVTNPVFEGIHKAQDEYVVRACQRIGVDINQEELIKALQYDRSQYEKGYADGLAYKPPVETNADRIRAMTDEELAYEFAKIEGDPYNGATIGFWLDWLKEEAKQIEENRKEKNNEHF